MIGKTKILNKTIIHSSYKEVLLMFNIGDTVLHYIGTPYKATITKIYKNGNVELTITEVLKEGEFKDIVERHHMQCSL